MPLFNLAPALVPANATRVYHMPLVGTLKVAPLTRSNKAFWSEYMARMIAAQTSGDLDSGSEERALALEAEMVGKYAIVDWAPDITDPSGVPVPWSPEKALAFARELSTTEGADHLFRKLRSFVGADDNFTNAAIEAAKAYAGNLFGG